MTDEQEGGLLLVFTGDGKGKTTASLGLALRAAGHGMRTHIIQFVKGPRPSGERQAVRRLDPLVTLEARGTGFLDPEDEAGVARAREAAQAAWERVCELLREPGLDILVLDELTVALTHHLLDPQEVLKALSRRRPGLHVIVTGRGAPQALCELAALVTEMQSRKHPYQRGRPAERGLDF